MTSSSCRMWVRANILAMESGVTGVYNITDGREIGVNEIAKELMDLFGILGSLCMKWDGKEMYTSRTWIFHGHGKRLDLSRWSHWRRGNGRLRTDFPCG